MRRTKQKKQDPVFVRFLFLAILLLLIYILGYYTYLLANETISVQTGEAMTSIAFSFMFPALVFTYLSFKDMPVKEIIMKLGLSRDKLNGTALKYGIVLFFLIIVVEVLFAAISVTTGIPLPTNVDQVLGGLPTYFLLFGIFITPFDEEILFRGFLVPRIGIILSACIFAFLHLTYLSVSEFLGALIYGLLAGYVYKKTGNLYATILGHLLVNMLTIVQFL